MNLAKLFEAQKELREVIFNRFPNLKEQNNLEWLVLALQVELGELANEHRGFKMWSEDREPRDKDIQCHACNGKGEFIADIEHFKIIKEGCTYCDGTGIQEKNPLLVEYADCLSFILEIGLELGTPRTWYDPIMIKHYKHKNVTVQFIYLNAGVCDTFQGDKDYEELTYEFLALGEVLGFTADQIEQAYYDKNKINHERQENGY